MHSHLNYFVPDTAMWEQATTYYLDTHPMVDAFVKNRNTASLQALTHVSVHGSLISITWKATDACLCRYHKRGFSGRFMVVVSVLFDQIVAMDLEGIACKRLDSPYKVTGKPSPYWIKVKNSRYSQLKGREELFDRVFSLLIPGMIP